MNLFKAWMVKEGITNVALSELTGMDIKTITNLRKIEDGSKIQLGTLIKLKEGLGGMVDLSDLFPIINKYSSIEDYNVKIQKQLYSLNRSVKRLDLDIEKLREKIKAL